MSKKTATRIIPNSAHDIGRNESWLHDMSAKGLYLRKFARRGVIFDRGEPKNLVYRIEVMTGEPTDEQLELYRASGWELVTRIDEMLCVFVTDGGLPVRELHNDTVVQSFAFEKLGGVLRRNVILIAVMIALLIALLLGVVVFQEEPILVMITGPAIQNTVLVFVELFVLLTVFENYWCAARLRKNLLNGIPINHNQPYKARAAVTQTISCVVLLLAAVTVVVPLYEIYQMTHSQITMTDSLPIVRLADVEQNPALVPEVHLDDRGIDHATTVNTDWSLLAPEQYSARESMTDGGDYSPTLNNDYYRLSVPALAEPLLQDLMNRHIVRYSEGVPTQMEVPGLDSAYVFSQKFCELVFVRKGAQVLFVSYYTGNAPIDRLLALAAAALDTPAG